jgi:hypothetical protein
MVNRPRHPTNLSARRTGPVRRIWTFDDDRR